MPEGWRSAAPAAMSCVGRDRRRVILAPLQITIKVSYTVPPRRAEE